MTPTKVLPFAALTEHTSARRCLLVAAVDPRLGGVLLIGPAGVGKSTVLAAFVDFVSMLDDARVVTVPLSVDRDRLIGGVDLERTLRSGRRVANPGLLEAARGGWLLLDNLHLAERRNLALVKQALDGDAAPAVLAAATDGESGAELRPWPHLADAIGLHANCTVGEAGSEAAADLIRRRIHHDADPVASTERWEEATGALLRSVTAARGRLAATVFPEAMARRLVDAALERGVVASRNDVQAWRAARAHAALSGSDEVGAADVDFAMEAVLASRTAHRSEAPSPMVSEPESRPAPPLSESTQGGESTQVGGNFAADQSGDAPAPPSLEAAPDRVVAPAEADPLPDLTSRFARARSTAPGGARVARATFDRGRHLRSRAHHHGRRLAVAETLRRAAVRQSRRPVEAGPVWPEGLAVQVRQDDLRYRELRSRAGALFVVAVDASGSMAFHQMHEAKGLVLSLLRDAYRNRDAVALVAFRGDRAERLLPPTSALARAHRELEVLATGGGTPLASALREVLALATEERRRRGRPTLALLLTDGRANVPLDPAASGRAAATAELERLAAAYRADGPPTLVIDSATPGCQREDARELAKWLGSSLHSL
ncbi:MAG: hypothetical protein CMJ83_22060 [Planctomycetes bacterium]|nr:hypothetical protein [Planctomycetota bacterium]